jgi:hypothetical protein
MAHSFWWLTCDALAVYRLAILATKDSITDPLREWLGKPWAYGGSPHSYRGARWRAFQLTGCPWCMSIWFAAGVVALTKFAPSAWQYGAMFLALSGIAGYLSERR